METQQRKLHPFVLRDITYFTRWDQWKEAWEKETKAEYLESLLFRGFGVPADYKEEVERICLYMDIADIRHGCWRPFLRDSSEEFRSLITSSFGREVDSIEKLRIFLADKAYKELSQNFFKNSTKDDKLWSWARPLTDPLVLKKMLWFFRPDKDVICNIFYPKGHHVEVANEFIRNFCDFVWKDVDGSYLGVSEESKKVFHDIRFHTIPILIALRKTSILLEVSEKVTPMCVRAWDEAVMSRSFHFDVRGSRSPRSLREACLKSSAARDLLVLKEMIAEQKNLDRRQATLNKSENR